MLIFLSYISYFSWDTFDLKMVTKCTENKAANARSLRQIDTKTSFFIRFISDRLGTNS